MVVYVQDEPAIPKTGTAYFAGNLLTTAREGDVSRKSAKGFDGSISKAVELYRIWQRYGFKGAPASPVGFFREHYAKMKRKRLLSNRTNATINAMVHSGFWAGWIEVMEDGVCGGPLYHYDINSAYLWAGMQGLPTRVRQYEKGDKTFLALCRVHSSTEFLPINIERQSKRGLVLLSNEDIDHYGISCDIERGVSWSQLDFCVSEVLTDLDGLPPWAYKRITQSYWGSWAARKPVVGRSYKNGEIVSEWEIFNRYQNLLWAQLIIGRVTRRLHEADQGRGKLVYVDSILTDRRIETSEEMGGFKLAGEFPRGVLIKAPGVWARIPDEAATRINNWHKHAGYASVY